jgi:hypothetical protein
MFGAHFTPLTNDQVTALAQPPAGGVAECIYHEYYDTQLFTSAVTLQSVFFQVSNADLTITNLPQGGQLPAPQLFQIYDVTLDILPVTPVSLMTAVGPATVVGQLTDFGLILFGAAQRGIWTLVLSNKNYGPYSLTALHGTGGPTGWFAGSSIATSSAMLQYARNDPSPGWNYLGRMIIPQQVNFYVQFQWAAVSTLAGGNPYLRLAFFGVLNRRTL